MNGPRAGRVVSWRASGCLPTLVALVGLAVIVATAVALGAFVVAGAAVLAAVLYLARAARRLFGREAPKPDAGHAWREVGREPLPPAAPPDPGEPAEPRDRP